jgi:ferric-dicitrate binding protein FerR (iron transport regulator)
MITTELLAKFFDNACSKEEAEEVYRYLQAHPEEVGKWWSEKEWMKFTDARDSFGSERSADMWDRIERGRRPMVRRMGWMRAAAAAIVVTTGYYLMTRQHKAPMVAKLAVVDTQYTNYGHQTVIDTLQDGSIAELYPGSVMTMKKGFEEDRRSVHLEGEAIFTVAEDKAKPFTVYTQGFATTALGTIFHITAYKDSHSTKVQLLQGKVLVKSLTHPGMATVLLPGGVFAVSEKTAPVAKIVRRPKSVPDLTAMNDSSFAEGSSEIVFKNLPLPRVLQLLSKAYHTPIYFNSAALNQRKFTGSVDKKQSLNNVLNSISLLNDLTIKPQGDGFRVTIP